MFRMEIFSLARLAKGKRIDPARQNEDYLTLMES